MLYFGVAQLTSKRGQLKTSQLCVCKKFCCLFPWWLSYGWLNTIITTGVLLHTCTHYDKYKYAFFWWFPSNPLWCNGSGISTLVFTLIVTTLLWVRAPLLRMFCFCKIFKVQRIPDDCRYLPRKKANNPLACVFKNLCSWCVIVTVIEYL